MLGEIILKLTAENSAELKFINGRLMHAAFFQILNSASPQLGNFIHEKMNLKPFTVSFLNPEKILKKITPLKAGNKFKSKIRFENLNEIELGALLMIFDLNGAKNPAYKIGMGKPLGLGSIKIFPKLFLESETAYTEIFDGDIFKNPCREENFAKYLDAFKNFVEERGMKKIWLGVMNELNLILDWDNTQKDSWQEKIKAMSGNVQSGNVDEKFVQRVPLQNIFEVVKC